MCFLLVVYMYGDKHIMLTPMQDYLDLRIQKTKRQLVDALIDILKNQTAKSTIKVLHICNKARISPITFYNHFGNKKELLEFTINEQLENIFPIPLKLQPKNLWHLIIYLINFFDKFCKQNKEIILNLSNNPKVKFSYLDLFLKIIERNVFCELKRINTSEARFALNMWTEMIVGGLTNLFLKRTIKNLNIINNNVIESTKKMFCCFHI